MTIRGERIATKDAITVARWATSLENVIQPDNVPFIVKQMEEAEEEEDTEGGVDLLLKTLTDAGTRNTRGEEVTAVRGEEAAPLSTRKIASTVLVIAMKRGRKSTGAATLLALQDDGNME